MCYEIVFGLINVDFHTFFRLAPSNNTRGHRYKLFVEQSTHNVRYYFCLLYTSPSPRDRQKSRMPSSA